MMPIVLLERKVILLMLVTICLVGCAGSDLRVFRHGKEVWRSASETAVAGAAEAAPPKILPETHFAAARLFESRGLFQKAITQYRKAIAVNHSYAEAYHRLGLLLSQTGQREEAVKVLARAVELKSDDAVYRNNLGFELLLSQRWADAQRELSRAIELKPDFAHAYVNLGIVQTRLGRFDDALATFQAVLPESDAYYNLGLMYRGQQRYDEAADAFRHLLSVNPDFTAAHTQLEQIASHLMPEPLPQTEMRVVEAIPSAEVDEPTEEPEVTEAPTQTVEAVEKDSWDQVFSWLEEVMVPAESAADGTAAERVVEERIPTDRKVSASSESAAGGSAIGEWMEDSDPNVDSLVAIDDAKDEPDATANRRNTLTVTDIEEAIVTVERFEAAEPFADAVIEEPIRHRRTIESRETETAVAGIGTFKSSEAEPFSDGDNLLTLAPWDDEEDGKSASGGLVDNVRKQSQAGEGPAQQGAVVEVRITSTATRLEPSKADRIQAEEQVCEADIFSVLTIAGPVDTEVCVVESDIEPTVVATSSTDSWAVLRELEEQLTVVRNEIACLESFDAQGVASASLGDLADPAVIAPSWPVFDVAPTVLFPADPPDKLVGPPALLAPKQNEIAALEFSGDTPSAPAAPVEPTFSRRAWVGRQARISVPQRRNDATEAGIARKAVKTLNDVKRSKVLDNLTSDTTTDTPTDETTPTDSALGGLSLSAFGGTLENLDGLLSVVFNEISGWKAEEADRIDPTEAVRVWQIAASREPEEEEVYTFRIPTGSIRPTPCPIFDLDADLLLPRTELESVNASTFKTRTIEEMEALMILRLDRNYRLRGFYKHHRKPLPD